MPVISEVMTIEQIEQAADYVDVYQVGARNMYNYELLKELGLQPKPVVLKRGLSATVDELLQAAEYILLGGNLQVILLVNAAFALLKRALAIRSISAPWPCSKILAICR